MALTSGRDAKSKYVAAPLVEYKIKASEVIYQGGLVNIATASGLAEAGDSTDGDIFVGVAQETVSSDASSKNAETGQTAKVKVMKDGYHCFLFSGAEITDLGKLVSVSDDQTVVAALPALTTALTGTNNDLVFTALAPYYGEAGKKISIQYIDPGAASQTEYIVVSGTGIVFYLATDSSANISSTGDTLKTTLAADAGAAALVSVADAASNDGSGLVTAMDATFLTGGPVVGRIVEIESTTEVFVDITGYAH